jgi:hypothetical protein
VARSGTLDENPGRLGIACVIALSTTVQVLMNASMTCVISKNRLLRVAASMGPR